MLLIFCLPHYCYNSLPFNIFFSNNFAVATCYPIYYRNFTTVYPLEGTISFIILLYSYPSYMLGQTSETCVHIFNTHVLPWIRPASSPEPLNKTTSYEFDGVFLELRHAIFSFIIIVFLLKFPLYLYCLLTFSQQCTYLCCYSFIIYYKHE